MLQQRARPAMHIPGIACVFFAACVVATGFPTTLMEGSGDPTRCVAAKAVEGNTATMTFFFREDINFYTDPVFASLRRGKDPDTLTCETRKTASRGILCDPVNPLFFPSAIVDKKLTIRIENVSRDMAGNYSMNIYVNHKLEPVVNCSLEVKDADSRDTSKSLTIIVIVIAVLVPIVCAVGVVIYCQRRRDLRCMRHIGCLKRSEGTSVLNQTGHPLMNMDKDTTQAHQNGHPSQDGAGMDPASLPKGTVKRMAQEVEAGCHG